MSYEAAGKKAAATFSAAAELITWVRKDFVVYIFQIKSALLKLSCILTVFGATGNTV